MGDPRKDPFEYFESLVTTWLAAARPAEVARLLDLDGAMRKVPSHG